MDTIYYFFTVLLIAVGLIQAAFLPHLQVFGHQIDLMLVFVVAWSLLRGVRQGMIWALIGGITLDIISAAPFGVFTVALIGASLASSLGAASLFRSYALLPALAILLGTLSFYVISFSALYLGGRDLVPSDVLMHVVLPALALNAGTMLIVFPGLRWLHRRTTPQQEMEW